MGGSTGSQTSSPNVPPQLSGLYSSTGAEVTQQQQENPLTNYNAPNIRNVPGMSQNQNYASSLVPGIGSNPYGNETIGDIRAAQQASQQKVTGANVATDPAVLAAQKAFEQGAAKNIINQQTLSGTGRMNTAQNALALAESQSMLPVIQDSLAREERGIDRSATGYSNAANQLGQLSNADLNQKISQFGAANTAGNTERDVATQQANAPYEDFLRRQGMAEQAAYGPLGQLPSTIGQNVKTSGGK